MSKPGLIACLLSLAAAWPAAASELSFLSELGGIRQLSLREMRAKFPAGRRLAAPADAEDEALRQVLQRLKGSSVPEAYVRTVFARPEVAIDPRVVEAYGRPPTPSPSGSYEDYRARLLTPARIAAGKDFTAAQSGLLAALSRDTGVDPALLTALVGIETFYGRHPGKIPVFNALYTAIHKVPRRKDFAARELAEYLKYTFADGLDPHSAKGSYAGAFGYAQFIPSSFNAYGVDRDGNGVREPFTWPDALASAANYLVRNGYAAGSDDFSQGSKNWWAIYAYNHSDYYVRVVIDLRAEILRPATPAPSAR